jgi:hypothetical protein
MSGDYKQGRADGLREALDILARLGDVEALKLKRESPFRTKLPRQTRWQAYRTAGTRITTALRKRERQVPSFAAAMKRLGL